MSARVRSRRLAAAGLGALVVVAYLVSAAVSGHLSPLARHPLLDGFSSPQPYKWVSPPPDQAGGNKQPLPAAKTFPFANQGASGYISTPDGQALLIIGRGAYRVPGAEGQTAVRVTIDPLDPATLAALPSPLEPSGNAYRVKAVFQPSGQTIDRFSGPVSVVLIYPATASAGLTPPVHTIMWSKDGKHWTKLQTQDSHQGLQAAGTMTAPGYVLVAMPPQSAGSQPASQLRLLAVAILIALGLFVVAGVIYVIRARHRGDE